MKPPLRLTLPVAVVGVLSAGALGLTSRVDAHPTNPPPPAPVVAKTGKTKVVAKVRDDRNSLERQLKRRGVVVLVLYSPDSSLDRLAIVEARAGSMAADAGFLAVDALDGEKEIVSLVLDEDARETPAVLVFRRGPKLVGKIAGFADRGTVAQLAANARS